MEKNFLEKISDKSDRIFPLNYKFVNIEKLNEKFTRRNIAIDFYNTAEYSPFHYTKPISKFL